MLINQLTPIVRPKKSRGKPPKMIKTPSPEPLTKLEPPQKQLIKIITI